MLKFEIGEHYISNDCDLLICADSNSCFSEFVLLNENRKMIVDRIDYGKIHDLKTEEQFKGMTFIFDSSLQFKKEFYHKIVELGGGTYQNNMTLGITHFITNKPSTSTTYMQLARRYKIKKFPENQFWKLYYKV
jgi:hypothetical protein